MSARIENYQIVNTQMVRLMEEEDGLIIWQKENTQKEYRFQFKTRVKNIFWNAYSLDLKSENVDRSLIEKDRPLFAYSKKLGIIFKGHVTKLSPYSLMISIPDSFIDLKRLPHGFNFEDIIPSHLVLIPGKATDEQIQKQKALEEFREYPRKRALQDVFFPMARKSEIFVKDQRQFRLFDLSRGGASFIVKKNDFQIGDVVIIKASYKKIKITGKIVYKTAFGDESKDRYKIGIKFLCLNQNFAAASSL